ncbi:MAG: radical SAM protein [Deltaproteobacteria bacterium]|nr:radical SAM protein [Deltaproteobacteria bacterium]
MKTIVLVNPPYSFWSPEKNYLRPFIGTLPSLGLLSLAAVLRDRGYAVKIIESASLGLTFSQTLENILRENPCYVGLSCTTASVDNAAGIAQAIKEVTPKILTFVGGPHITAIPRETFQRYPFFDYGVIGEGERAFRYLLEAIEEGGGLKGVESAVFREGERIVINPRRKFIENLDELPFPAYDLLPSFPGSYRLPFLNYLKGPAASVVSSRGCPQVCTFCDRSVFGNRYRYFSEEYLFDLISYLRRQYGIEHLAFADDQFAASRPRLVRFCEKIARAGLKIRWNCDARVDSVDSALLKLMKKAGCWMISYGIESGSPEILAGIHKDIRLDQVEQAAHWTKEAGIRAKGLFMIGYPEETESTLRQTLSLILRCPFDELNLSFLTPYPGTKIYEQAKRSPGFTEDWSRMNALNCIFHPQALSVGALKKAYAGLIRKFYMRPRITFSYLGLLGRSPENCSRLAAGISRWLLTR